MSDEPRNVIKDLPKIQRRVVGALMEKAFTTPDQYPLTLKAATTACNQKSNRDPVVSYSESQVQDALDALREDLLVAEVFTGGGRAPRYRHYMRHKFDFSEAQFAIIAELLLRGRQQPGELRTRASRMVRIGSQEQLRDELQNLKEKGYVQANGPLDRRGIEVDHTFYLAKENMDIGDAAPVADDSEGLRESQSSTPQPAPVAQHGPAENLLKQLHDQIREQAETIEKLEAAFAGLDERLQRMERDLGV